MPYQLGRKSYVTANEAVELGYVDLTPHRLRARIKLIRPSKLKNFVEYITHEGKDIMVIETEFVKTIKPLRKKPESKKIPSVPYEQKLKTIHSFTVNERDRKALIAYAETFECQHPFFYTYTHLKKGFVLHLVLPFETIDNSMLPSCNLEMRTTRNFSSLVKILNNAEKNEKIVFKNIEYKQFIAKYLQ